MDDLSEPFGDGLPVKLIATPRDDLTVCNIDENVETVRCRNIDDYDHIPVLDHDRIIIGSLGAKKDGPGDHLVAEAMDRLNGRLICGESSSIVDFIEGIRTQPFCFTVGKSGISGLVTWSDIQKLPARAALFARVTQLELVMMERIRQLFPRDEWMGHLSSRRRKMVAKKIEAAREQDSWIDSLHYTGFCDKRDLLKKWHGGQTFNQSLMNIEELRNALAHAGSYALTHEAALAVSKQVADIAEWIRQLTVKVPDGAA